MYFVDAFHQVPLFSQEWHQALQTRMLFFMYAKKCDEHMLLVYQNVITQTCAFLTINSSSYLICESLQSHSNVMIWFAVPEYSNLETFPIKRTFFCSQNLCLKSCVKSVIVLRSSEFWHN